MIDENKARIIHKIYFVKKSSHKFLKQLDNYEIA